MQKKSMQVVVLMGGLGSRLGEITANQPKPLVDVCGKPFFEYELNLLLGYGFRRFVFLVGYRAEMIEEYFGNGSQYGDDVSIQYSYDGEKLLGTGGAVVRAISSLQDEFMLIYGDSYMDVDYEEILYRFREGKDNGKPALMTVLKNEGRFDSSNVRMLGSEIETYKKGVRDSSYNYIDYGIEVFSKDIFVDLPRNTTIDLADIQEWLTDEGKMAACEVYKRFYEIGSPNSLMEFENYIHDRFWKSCPAVFLDRDGVINEICYNDDIEQLDSPLHLDEFRVLPMVPNAIKLFNDAGYYVFVVTNQPAAAKGKTTLIELYDINHYMTRILKEGDCIINETVMCPHHPKGVDSSKYKALICECDCRKPKTGLIDLITGKYNIDKERSWMIGDSYTDIQTGRSAGLHTAFIGEFKCDVCARLMYNKPDIIATDLYDGTSKILGII